MNDRWREQLVLSEIRGIWIQEMDTGDGYRRSMDTVDTVDTVELLESTVCQIVNSHIHTEYI